MRGKGFWKCHEAAQGEPYAVLTEIMTLNITSIVTTIDISISALYTVLVITLKTSATLASISELRNKSEQILSQLKENRVILERHKKPVAVMLDYAQYEKLEAMVELAEDLVLGSIAHERDRSAKKRDFLDLDQW